MRRNASCCRRFFRSGVWRSLVSAVVNVALGASIAPSAGQSLVMQEPDFDGMFTVDYVPHAPVMRDLARGWTYFVGPGNADGVAFSQRLFRVSDAGIPDGQWRLPSDFKITDQYLAPDGALIVRAAVLNGPVYESRWYRLRPESIGQITPAEISSMAELPPRDAIRLDLPSFGTFRLRQGDGTSIAIEVIVGQPPAYTPIKFLRKRNASGDELWSHVIGGTPRNLATDARGNVYVLGESISISGTTGNLSRIRSDGRVDTSWSPNFNTASNVESTVRVMTDRIVVADVIRGSPSVNRLTTFDLVTGAKVVERYPQYVLGGIAEDGSTLSAHADARWSVLDTRRNDEADDRISTARVGSPPLPRTSVRWRDGYVIGGNFVYWFDGQLYRNLMRVDASFRPDPTWTPPIDGTVAALAVDTQGRLIVGSNSASGREGRLARFSANGALDAGWHPVITGDVYKIYPSSDGLLFIGGAFSAIDGVQRQSLARFSADGLLDRDWASQPTWPRMEAVRWQQSGRDGIYQILDAGTDGVYFIWENGYTSDEDGYKYGPAADFVRLSREGIGDELPVQSGLAVAPEYYVGRGSMMRDTATGAIYAIANAWKISGFLKQGTALIRLLPPHMVVDAAWTAYAGDYGRQFYRFAYQTDAHVYVCRSNGDPEVRRFDKLTGREDPDWRSDETYLCTASAFERGTDGSTTVFAEYGDSPTRYSRTARNEPRTVVEYYARTAKRFFMTGRANEIALLDGLSANFSRTGMQFSAETATVRTSDTTRTPICRFYAPPEASGSNTHFYGRDSDCTMLKRFPTLRYEGYDFRAGLPDSVGACPSALPQPVYRLFNQATASNNGNHRYVVSEARKNEMIAAGWVSEGIAFCTTSVTDSRSLAEIAQ